MDFTIVLDVSAVIWDETDYKKNKNHYYRLSDGIDILFDKLFSEILYKDNDIKILMRTELKDEIYANFPYGKIPHDYNEFEKQALKFIGNCPQLKYTSKSISHLVSIPNQIKEYFNDTIKNEVSYLLAKIHSDFSLQSVYFTFEYLWNSKDALKTEAGKNVKEYETIISDKENELDIFIAQFKPVFEHNPKHDKTPRNTREKWEQEEDKSKIESRLSCYNGKDNIRPQALLDSAYKFGSCYYNYDNENDTFVVFRNTRQNIYHAYDEYDPERIPNEVRNKLHK